MFVIFSKDKAFWGSNTPPRCWRFAGSNGQLPIQFLGFRWEGFALANLFEGTSWKPHPNHAWILLLLIIITIILVTVFFFAKPKKYDVVAKGGSTNYTKCFRRCIFYEKTFCWGNASWLFSPSVVLVNLEALTYLGQANTHATSRFFRNMTLNSKNSRLEALLFKHPGVRGFTSDVMMGLAALPAYSGLKDWEAKLGS